MTVSQVIAVAWWLCGCVGAYVVRAKAWAHIPDRDIGWGGTMILAIVVGMGPLGIAVAMIAWTVVATKRSQR